MITLCSKFHKCPYTGEIADHIILDSVTNLDPIQFFVSSTAVKRFYSNLYAKQILKVPTESANKSIVDQLAKLNHPVFQVLRESSGADVSQRVKFAQEIINLCMPVAARTVAHFVLWQHQLEQSVKSFDEVKESLWESFVENVNQRLSLKKRKFKTCAILEKEALKQIDLYFFTLVEKLYKSVVASYSVKESKAAPVSARKNPFTEEHKAFEPFRKEAAFISKVKSEKVRVPLQSPYATTYNGNEKFTDKKQFEYEMPKSVPDLGFNHFREGAQIQRTDTSLNLNFTANAQNVSNTTFYTLLENLPKFGKLTSLSIDISGSQNFGAVGFGYLKGALMKLNLESFSIRAAGCQGLNDVCVEHLVQGLSKNTKLKSFSLYAPDCPAVSEASLNTIQQLSQNNKSLKRLAIDFSGNKSIKDTGLSALKKVLSDVVLSHLELHFDKCENLTKKAKENMRACIRNCPKIGFYKLT